MRALDYAFRQAWASLARNRTSGAFAVTSIALAVIVLGGLLVATWNLERWLERWTSAAEFSVYLRDDATSEQRGALESVLDGADVVVGTEYVSKATALARFRESFTPLAALADEIGDNPFPASLEVRVASDAARDARVTELVRRVGAMAGVADVRYDREWVTRLARGLGTLRLVGLALAALMATAAGVTVATVVRLGLYARRTEIEIMELVGSPLAFIRGPFVAEGVLQGGVGALLAVVVLWTGFSIGVTWWGAELTGALEDLRPEFLPWRLCVALVLGGMAVGAAGGFAATRHAG